VTTFDTNIMSEIRFEVVCPLMEPGLEKKPEALGNG